MSYSEFWGSTYKELITILTVRHKKEEAEAKDKLIRDYYLAANIVGFFGSSFDGKPIPTIEELYPNLNVNTEQQSNPHLEALKTKEQLKRFAKEFNKQKIEKDELC